MWFLIHRGQESSFNRASITKLALQHIEVCLPGKMKSFRQAEVVLQQSATSGWNHQSVWFPGEILVSGKALKEKFSQTEIEMKIHKRKKYTRGSMA